MTIDPQLYSIAVHPIVWGLLGAMLLCMIIIASVMWPKLRRVCRRVAADDLEPLPDGGYPSVSVVVYSQSDGENLRTLLPQILNQDYPAPMEVIVVNDAGTDDTETIVSELELRYSNLYMTFAPDHSRSLSRKKLSITLGIKAARYDVLMLTAGNCRVNSDKWLRYMMRSIVRGKEVVIGYAALRAGDGSTDNDSRRRRRAFDVVWQSVRYLSSAICGRPFMATGYNLAYTRRLFFAHKGFSKTLHLNFGDDDLFVNEIANRRNAAVELAHEARVEALLQSPADAHDTYRMRSDYTAKLLPRRTYRTMGLTSLLWWIWPACGIAASLLGWPSLVPAAASLLLSLIFCFIGMAFWRKCSRALDSRKLFLTVPWLAWTRPLRTLRHKIVGRRGRKSHFTRMQ